MDKDRICIQCGVGVTFHSSNSQSQQRTRTHETAPNLPKCPLLRLALHITSPTECSSSYYYHLCH